MSKYWVSKRWPAHSAEALECLGGNGYVEESGMPRLFRESPLNSIWEGSGNVAALDALRAMMRQPETVEAFFEEVEAAAGADARLDTAVAQVKDALTDAATIELRARRIVERLALVLQGSLLVRHGHPAVADAFCASRLGRDWGTAFGTLPRVWTSTPSSPAPPRKPADAEPTKKPGLDLGTASTVRRSPRRAVRPDGLGTPSGRPYRTSGGVTVQAHSRSCRRVVTEPAAALPARPRPSRDVLLHRPVYLRHLPESSGRATTVPEATP